MKHHLPHLFFAATAAFFAATIPSVVAQAQHTVWFDEPTSFAGHAIWTQEIPEGAPADYKPVNAGEQNWNRDREWEQRSLPLGNGSLGANVMGSIATERYTLNEKTLWRGGPGTADGPAHYWNQNKESAHLLPQIRQAFLDGDLNKAAELTMRNFNSTVPYEAKGERSFRFGSFTTLGELCIETGLNDKDARHYRRALSIDSAFATVSFTANGVDYRRETFISYPHNVMAIRFSASEKGKQQLRLAYMPNPCAEGKVTATANGNLLYEGRLDNNGMQFVVRLQAQAKGGTLAAEGGTLVVRNADEVVILLTADTDYKPNYDPDLNDAKAYVGVNPLATTEGWMRKACKTSWNKLLQAHLRDYTALFGRVKFQLDKSTSALPTNKRLEAYRKGAKDQGLETLYYQFGRYLLIASSRPGNMPANLQGIWHNNVDGPWRVDYHNNINLQMNYWPALMTNLSECAEPLTDFIRTLEKPGERTAKAYWGARGWAAGISGNIFGFTAPLEGMDMSWNYNPMAASWLATHLWDYYDYTRDTDFLRTTAYPLMKGCALFTEDFLWRKPDGTLTAAPSTSPEHGPVDEGTTFTHAVAREILMRCIQAARTLRIDETDAARWEAILAQMAPYKVGRYGQLMEWSRDIDDPKDEHRHVNHLFGLHPGHTVSPLTTPELAKAARVVLEHRGDGATGWSMGWKLNQWARLHDGNHSYTLYGNLLKNGTADNLWDVHPPFQIDGNFGGTAGVTEMLLQSHAGCIHLLPSLPDAWQEGSITGLRARGNFGVDIYWQGGRLQRAIVSSDSGEPCTLRYGSHTLTFPTERGKAYVITLNAKGNLEKK
ncbi:MAG: glycoside hydrolase family 95 protein [Alloprevotella sp.]|nr:glycoside hydrolase family 95 protein [Alloprevotella sp.]